MSLGIVIPVWNDPEGLKRLLSQIASLKIAEQIVVVDDSSDTERKCDIKAIYPDLPITLIELEERRGAGYARNCGLSAISTEHVIFFDSDDLFLEGILALYRRLQGRDFDFCIFRHVDSRERESGHIGMMSSDQDCWDKAGMQSAALSLLDTAQAAALAPVAAYPWNKIYRTAFLRNNGIRCTEIPVHNDIELHWRSFLSAKRILASSFLCAEHFVVDNGERLTNRSCHTRLRVFEALTPLHSLLRNHVQPTLFLVPFMGFYTRLFYWISENLDAEHQPQFHRLATKFILSQPTEEELSLFALWDPITAEDMLRLVKRGLQ
ncbi:MAG: glycosyl transferase [Halobacteriovoraceae bacterium]|nr:glycosyl transferase [Halobacteriovoraceae bacterium]|tara:strand:- start:623 stop:1585 length:963 start_codon:yes stop_codon:yes gene_type:complete